jgi:hypothetical protein
MMARSAEVAGSAMEGNGRASALRSAAGQRNHFVGLFKDMPRHAR